MAAKSGWLYRCEWPECETYGSHRIRRGEEMTPMIVCAGHRQEFHRLTLPAAWRIHELRQPMRRESANYWHLGCLPRVEPADGQGR